ncbi:MAG TPA: NAD(+)/NADH kinase [Acidimicrobiia bacterium]
MKAIALVVNPDRPAAAELAVRAAKWCAEQGVAVQVAASERAAVPPGAAEVDADALAAGADLIMSLGGDGTMLHTVDIVYPTTVPIVGINAGQLGYLNAFEASELETALDRIARGDFDVQQRSMVECVVETPQHEVRWFGLNEVVLERVDSGRLVRLEVAINGAPFTTYAADGVIVSTPTGSTAYSFSVRGPIVSPTGRLLALTPVSPHMLFDRSLVLAADETIELSVIDECAVALFVDGRPCCELGVGARVRCRVADEPITIVAPREMGFHQILKAKFSLPDR